MSTNSKGKNALLITLLVLACLLCAGIFFGVIGFVVFRNLSQVTPRTHHTTEETTDETEHTNITNAPVDPNAPEWTVMIYMCGTNLETEHGIASMVLDGMNDFKNSDDVNIIVQTGGTAKWNNKDNYFRGDAVQKINIPNDKLGRYKIEHNNIIDLGAAPLESMGSDETLSDVNQFVYDNTDGMIDKIIDSVPSLSNMILVDALSFEGKWDKAFEDEDIDENGTFTLEEGSSKTVTMLNGKAGEYFEVSGGCGFIYPYKGDRYSFAAILPEEGTKMQDFISNVSGEEIVDSMKNCEYTRVVFSIPEFTFDCSMELSDTFREMGANRVFTGDADFSNMLTENGKYSIDSILHKTHIELNREGTKAAAVTGMVLNSAGPGKADVKQVISDRPFIYMIIDNETKTPIFMGHADNIE